MSAPNTNLADYILPLNMNGLSGRMLRLPAKKKSSREILLVYGHHSSIERWAGLAEYLHGFGSVTMPDLPGFGGMDPYYKIGQKPTIDALADYLAAFVKLRYKNRRFSVIGLSLGFVIVTRMLQKYPELAKKTDIVVSIVGFTNKKDFIFSKPKHMLFRYASSFFSNRLPSAILKYIAFRPIFIRIIYKIMANRNPKLKHASAETRSEWVDFEIGLWRCNDPRTWTETALSMMILDLPKNHIDMPVHHVAIKKDRYLDNVMVEQHMREIYSDFIVYKIKLSLHAPSVMASAADAARYVPAQLRNVFKT